MKTEPKTKFTKDIVPKAISLLLALTDSPPVLILYIFTVLWYTVLNRAENYEIPQLELFWSFRKFLTGDPGLGIEIAGNVIMFMPFGFLLCDLFYKWTHARTSYQSVYPTTSPASNLPAKRISIRKNSQFIVSSAFSPSDYPMKKSSGKLSKWLLIPLLSLSFSLLIEILQMTLVRGLAEVDDLFTNTLGAVLGICSYEVLRKLSGERAFEAVHAIIRVAFVLICFIILIFDRKLYPFKENNLTRSFCFQVDEVSIQGNEMTLRGFAFGYNRPLNPPHLVLRPTKAGDLLAMDVSLRQTKTVNDIDADNIEMDVTYGAARPDVNAYFLCDYNYTNVGFTATGIASSETEYEIMIGWPLSKLVSTGVYILGEDVHRVAYEETYNEKMIEAEKEEPQIGTTEDETLRKAPEREDPSDTDDEEIIFGTAKEVNLAGSGVFKLPDLPTNYVKNGTLLVCRPDMHIWIFQYDGYLYWIADERFHFEDDGLTYIQYQLWTTQIEKLPPRRLKANHFWSNLGGYFEKYELSGDFGKYRVMRCELPTEYSITSILSGYYKNGEWFWSNSFRPVYEF